MQYTIRYHQTVETYCDVVFLPCGHVCTCSSCSLLISACPLCRVAVDDKLWRHLCVQIGINVFPKPQVDCIGHKHGEHLYTAI
ncbi:unnamed protein product [Oppiella nova]|uniref:RING-type domain-containing protein n=1 Tax=Oppiella nova TaxID=334625 RepID=A0A7R9MDU9_9ACAR|nr:unnamed protein product [Oppiella nova]CAG2175547.1 unnamed protein product [Oppiella nova]